MSSDLSLPYRRLQFCETTNFDEAPSDIVAVPLDQLEGEEDGVDSLMEIV